MDSYQSASTVVNDQFTFFQVPTRPQDVPIFGRNSSKKEEKKPVTRFALVLGCIEIVISIILYGGFVTPLEHSPMYIVWVIALFSIMIGFNGLLSITSCWCGASISLYFVIIRIVIGSIAIGMVALELYLSATFVGKKEWKNHIFVLIGLILLEAILSLTSLISVLRFMVKNCDSLSKKSEMLPFMNTGENEFRIPLALNYNEPSYPMRDSRNQSATTIDAPGTPPPTYNDVRSSLMYERMIRN